MEQTVFYEQNELRVRPKKMTAGEILGLQSIIETNDFDEATRMYNTIFEHCEVEILGVWCPLKEKGAEVYNPATIADDVRTLYQIATSFLTKVMMPVFRKSGESKK